MTITLEWLQARCREEDGHLIWLRCCHGSNPVAQIAGKGVSVRRTIWEQVHNAKAGPRLVVARCEHEHCVHPDCLRVVSKKVFRAEQQVRSDNWLRIALGHRRSSKLSQEAVAAIRASDLPQPAIAAAYGITQSYVSQIRRGKWRRELTSPFAGLLA